MGRLLSCDNVSLRFQYSYKTLQCFSKRVAGCETKKEGRSRLVTFDAPSCVWQTDGQFGPHRRWDTQSKGCYTRHSTDVHM